MKLLPTSLFGRMFVLSLLATLAALAIAGIAIGGIMQRFVIEGVDARLGDRLTALESAVRPDGGIDSAQLTRLTTRIAPEEPWRVDLPGGQTIGAQDLIARDDHRLGPPLPLGPPLLTSNDARPFEARLADGRRVHGLTAVVVTAAGEARVAVAVPRDRIDRPVFAALMPLAISLLVLGLALGSAAVVQLRLGLRPLAKLQAAVEAIRRGQATRVPEDVPDELAPLARELNALAADTDTALANARASAANLAHALKTPVATLGLHLAGDAMAQAQLSRIDATLRHHLGRARTAATDRRAATLLAPALNDLAATVARLHGGRIAIEVDAPDDLSASIGAQDLDELAGNLIDNAARHAVTRVTVMAQAEDRVIHLSIADDGPGIPAADRLRATAPGTRLDERGDGHGFGLTIARELAELHGGALTLDDAPGGGLLARVTLPRAS
ncbi:sensor histidine kinase [Sphingomonas floccifaciens]|uniref:histidine kinase n=1 Tax=Sphingomonas floccifaciens TaxID=1844115 RepID=A0ABW4NAN7_9SPHN